MAFDKTEGEEIAPDVFLYYITGAGFYVHRKAPEGSPSPNYFTRFGEWDWNCVSGWFETAELAISCYRTFNPRTSQPSPPPNPISPALDESIDWIERLPE